MSKTLDSIQSEMAAYLDQDENVSNLDSTDYSLRKKYINMALTEWSEIGNWQTLYKEYDYLVPTSSANASITLPGNFRKLSSFPKIANGSDTALYPDTRPQTAGQYQDTEKRVEILGNPLDGYTMRVYGVTLASGASIKVPYFRSPMSLASPANVAEVPNPDFLTKRAIAYVLEAREDARFPGMKEEADRILANMIDFENTFSEASADDRVKSVLETRYNFRMGE